MNVVWFVCLQGLNQIRGLATSLPNLNWGLLSQMSSLRLLFLDGTHLDGDNEGLEGLEIGWLKCPAVDENPSNELLGLEFLTILELRPWRRPQVSSFLLFSFFFFGILDLQDFVIS